MEQQVPPKRLYLSINKTAHTILKYIRVFPHRNHEHVLCYPCLSLPFKPRNTGPISNELSTWAKSILETKNRDFQLIRTPPPVMKHEGSESVCNLLQLETVVNRLNLGLSFYPYWFDPVYLIFAIIFVFAFYLMLHSVFQDVECDDRVIKLIINFK